MGLLRDRWGAWKGTLHVKSGSEIVSRDVARIGDLDLSTDSTHSRFETFAVVTPDGIWHEKGQMGWWGFSSDTPEEALDWRLHYKERFLDTADPDWEITVVDCHI